MSRFEGHQQGETKRDEAVFTESAAVKVSYILLRLSTSSRHNRANRQNAITNAVTLLSPGPAPCPASVQCLVNLVAPQGFEPRTNR
jgi:hypothetical protein